MKSSQIRQSMQGGYDPTAFLVPIILLGLHAAVQNPKQLDSVSKKIKVSKSRKSSKMSGGGGDLDIAQKYSLDKMVEMLGGFSELFDMQNTESFNNAQQEASELMPSKGEAEMTEMLPAEGGDSYMLEGGSHHTKKRSSDRAKRASKKSLK